MCLQFEIFHDRYGKIKNINAPQYLKVFKNHRWGSPCQKYLSLEYILVWGDDLMIIEEKDLQCSEF